MLFYTDDLIILLENEKSLKYVTSKVLYKTLNDTCRIHRSV